MSLSIKKQTEISTPLLLVWNMSRGDSVISVFWGQCYHGNEVFIASLERDKKLIMTQLVEN